MRQLITSRLIWICTVCHSVIDFRLKPLFASMDVSNFIDGKSPLQKLRGERVMDPAKSTMPYAYLCILLSLLTFTSLWAISAYDKFMILFFFFFFFHKNRLCHFMQFVSNEDNLHEISKPIFWEKKNFKMKSDEILPSMLSVNCLHTQIATEHTITNWNIQTIIYAIYILKFQKRRLSGDIK